MTPEGSTSRVKVLYLAPWVDYGGSDKGTIDWFRWLDRDRFAPSLACTQPSLNRRLAEVIPYAEEVWPLPDLMAGQYMPRWIFDFIVTREVEILHIMNSRLAYEILPDLASLSRPPRVAVQLHVEEQDRSGYVRLVCSRYGNLVDAFSVSSEHLAQAVERYDVPSSKIHVIPTGVDAEGEYCPSRAARREDLDPSSIHVLYAGRLVEQKDPGLMIDVAAECVHDDGRLHFQVVGDGPLEAELRRSVDARRLTDNVHFHPPTTQLASWYASCDILLMTSVFEGVPYVAYEAMAMGLPVVAPALPGMVELSAGNGDFLVEPRHDVEGYVRAVHALANSRDLRIETGSRSRKRALGDLSVRAMARSHEKMYDELLAARSAVPEPRPRNSKVDQSASVRLYRPRRGTPLVSVIVPCFNHGRYLRECIDSIRRQTYGHTEIIVVDDASTDGHTLGEIDALERAADIQVIRMPENAGPGTARNAALDRLQGSFVLPVDADNLLLPDAIERLLGQLREAGPVVGFVYPNLQYFGNRRDYFECPDYNLVSLLEGNFCDTCSLFDNELFRAGIRFADDIRLGHEDWDLALRMAAIGVQGVPANGPTLLYRKSGFTRSDAVEYGSEAFAETVRGRHPELFGTDADLGVWGRHSGPAVAIKSRWSPGLSVVALEPVEPGTEVGDELDARLRAQSYLDLELIVRSSRDWPRHGDGPPVRRVPTELASDQATALADALTVARAPLTLVTSGNGSSLLADAAFAEKLLRALATAPETQAIVLCDAGSAGRYDLRLLDGSEAVDRAPHSVLFRTGERTLRLPDRAGLDSLSPVDSLVRLMAGQSGVQWRHLSAPAHMPSENGHTQFVRVTQPPPPRRSARVELERRMSRAPALPSVPWDQVRRWTLARAWMPPETLPLVRHRRIGSEDRIVTNETLPPDGFVIEFELGTIHRFQPSGTAELRAEGARCYRTIPDADEGAPRLRFPRDERCLGFVEEAAFPLLDPLELGFHSGSGQWLLVSGEADPLFGSVTSRVTLGFIEAYPNHPRFPTIQARHYGHVSLTRAVDRSSRRHRYGVDGVPPGTLSLELGSLHTVPEPDSIVVRLIDGRVYAGSLPAVPNARPAAIARWVAAPVRWRGVADFVPRVRASAGRLRDAARLTQRRPLVIDPGRDESVGYLWASDGEARRAVFEASHPITGDQLLTAWPLEANDLGYGEIRLLGWVSTASTMTGGLAPRPVDIPWASRFARRVRYA